LLLGLRGTISEVELHCIKERLDGARMSKARRGNCHCVSRPAMWLARMGRSSSIPIRKYRGRSGPSLRSSSGWAQLPRSCTSSRTMGSRFPGAAGTPGAGRRSSGCAPAIRRPCRRRGGGGGGVVGPARPAG
jgi:hypothetical protein